MKGRVCELCNGEAALYCCSDSAFLCWNCDMKVHGANFLVARHSRRTICSKCKEFTSILLSGVNYRPLCHICNSCSSELPSDELDSLISSSSASGCVSSTESCATRPKKLNDFDRLKSAATTTVVSSRSDIDISSKCSKFPEETRQRVSSIVDSKAEDILVNWCRKLGLSSSSSNYSMVEMGFGVCRDKLTVWPLRVCLAASLWFSTRFCEKRAVRKWQVLKRVEEISGVPAKVILSAESKLRRVLKMRKVRHHQEEGGAESSSSSSCSCSS